MKKIIFLIFLFLAGTASADLVGDLGKAMVDAIYLPSYNAFYELANAFMGLVMGLLLWNPPLDIAYDAWNTVRTVITSMYLAVITYAGLKLMIGTLAGGNERATLKRWLGGSILSLLLVNMSYALYGFILEFNVALSAMLFQEPNLMGFMAAIGTYAILLLVHTAVVLALIMLLMARLIFVLVGVILFPIGIFLYYLPPTKRFGKLLITLILMNIFIQFIEVVCLRFAMDAFAAMNGSFTGTIFNAVFGIAMIYLMIAVPLFAYGIAAFAGMLLRKTTEVVTSVVPIPIDAFKTRREK